MSSRLVCHGQASAPFRALIESELGLRKNTREVVYGRPRAAMPFRDFLPPLTVQSAARLGLGSPRTPFFAPSQRIRSQHPTGPPCDTARIQSADPTPTPPSPRGIVKDPKCFRDSPATAMTEVSSTRLYLGNLPRNGSSNCRPSSPRRPRLTRRRLKRPRVTSRLISRHTAPGKSSR